MEPLKDPNNEYNRAYQDFIENGYGDYIDRELENDPTFEFTSDYQAYLEWEQDQQAKISEAFKRVKKRLDANKSFYFGCPLANYKATFESRLKEFLSAYIDVNVTDFIRSETEYLQKSLESNDNWALKEQIGFKQYELSTEKKLSFLGYYKQDVPATPGAPKDKFITKDHVITFILDCFANGEILPNGSGKPKLEAIGRSRIGGTSGNTFYKVYNDKDILHIKTDPPKEADLITAIGDNWREVVLYLSKDPKTLKGYLERHNI